MMNKMMDKKLSVAELAMVNGGYDLDDLKKDAKLAWGLITRDPEAIATYGLVRDMYDEALERGRKARKEREMNK